MILLESDSTQLYSRRGEGGRRVCVPGGRCHVTLFTYRLCALARVVTRFVRDIYSRDLKLLSYVLASGKGDDRMPRKM